MIDADAGATRRHHTLLNVGERDITTRDPVRPLCCFVGKRFAARDVRGHVDVQFRNGWRASRPRLATEVSGQRFLEDSRERSIAEPSGSRDACMYSDTARSNPTSFSTIAPARRASWLVIVLHGQNRFDGLARGLRGQPMADQNDRDHGCETECESSTDAEFQASRWRSRDQPEMRVFLA